MTEQSLTRHNRELSILNTIAEALNRTPDLDQILNVTLAKLAELLDLHTAWIWLLRTENGDSYLAAHQNLPPALAEKPERMEGSCYCLDTYRSGDLAGAANINVITCSRLEFLTNTDGLRYHTSIPLYADERQLGVLNVASKDWRELSGEDLRLLHTAGDMLGMAIERARLFQHSRMIGALEERNRLAREMHDTLAQGLTAIAMSLETADALIEAGDEAGQFQIFLQRAIRLTRSTLEEARRSVLDLRTAPMEGHTLAEALNILAAPYRRDRRVHTIVVTQGKVPPLPARIEAGLYRIAQEALTNALRHAQADEVLLRLKTSPNRVELVIEDDGVGFSVDTIPDGRFGLVGMNERARLMGGDLEIQSALAEGTRVIVNIPLP
jgi:two-component system NarL family sensor kinase